MALALPCLPGGAEKLRQLADECRAPRRDDFAAFDPRVGLDAERWYWAFPSTARSRPLITLNATIRACDPQPDSLE